MDIQLVSFILALVVGIVCFGLVKYTADEFDQWYDDMVPAKLRVPVAVSTLATFLGIAFVIFSR